MEKWLVRIIFGFLFFIPLILQLNPWGFSTWLKGYVRIGTPNEWFGFWGSYIGSILSISFAYINSKIEANRQKESIERQLEQSKINDLDNAIKIDEINNLTMILGEISDYISDTSYLSLLGVPPNEVGLDMFNSFADEYAKINAKYIKDWNKFILRYYTDENEQAKLLNLNAKVTNISMKIGNNINQCRAKINSNSDNQLSITILQEISQNLNDLVDASEKLRLYVLDLLSENKTGIQNKQDNLDSKSKAVF